MVLSRWREIPDMSAHLDDHTIVFNDVHFGPLLGRRGEVENENHLYESLKKYTKSEFTLFSQIYKVRKVVRNSWEGDIDNLLPYELSKLLICSTFCRVQVFSCSDEDNAKVCQLVGLSLYEGMMAFEREKYELAAEKMLPIRQHIYRIGGSNAQVRQNFLKFRKSAHLRKFRKLKTFQRDIFTQTLIHACILSKNREHNALVE